MSVHYTPNSVKIMKAETQEHGGRLPAKPSTPRGKRRAASKK